MFSVAFLILEGMRDLLRRFLVKDSGLSIVVSITEFRFIRPEILLFIVKSVVSLRCWKMSFYDAPKIVLLSLGIVLMIVWSTLRAEFNLINSSGEGLKFNVFFGLDYPKTPTLWGNPYLVEFILMTFFLKPFSATVPLWSSPRKWEIETFVSGEW